MTQLPEHILVKVAPISAKIYELADLRNSRPIIFTEQIMNFSHEIHNMGVECHSEELYVAVREVFDKYPDEKKMSKPRKILQELGSTVRELTCRDIWLRFVLKAVDSEAIESITIIPDLRLKREYDILKEREDFDLIRIEVDEVERRKRYFDIYGDNFDQVFAHHTETELDGIQDWNYVLNNPSLEVMELFATNYVNSEM